MRFALLLIMLLSTAMLSGCLYPEEERAGNRVPYEDQLAAVQKAVDQYRETENGLLPIKTRDMSTPVYRKYPIDFNKLIPAYMQDAPGNSFESGGIYQYVLINVETDPEVKLIDLQTAEYIRELKVNLNLHRKKHGYPPFSEVLANGRYTLDYEKLGYSSPPKVPSPFSDSFLPLIIDNKGEVFVDYRIDLNRKLQSGEYDFEYGDDIRSILVEDSPFVPAFSVPYTIKDGEPVFLTEDAGNADKHK
ncbi:hypothetical protein [Bacillus marinisedimentorum]|uniref:hypothetical protein n=1 Tax=Bacillus marinisedimentorum TaxID=1821260 RepID=UPI0008733C2C|nr:hypothetical protein [Bacillus marinisedimentorum]